MALAFVAQRAYRAGGSAINFVTQTAYEYDPEYAWNYELSWRGNVVNFGRGRLQYRLNAFYLQWRDQQVNVPQLPGDFSSDIILNAGRSTVKGGEFELNWTSGKGLSAYTASGIADTTFKEFSFLQFGQLRDLTGDPFPQAPGVTANVGAQYQHRSGIFGGADITHTGSALSRSLLEAGLRTRSTDVVSIDALIDRIIAAAPPKPRGSLLLVWPFGHRPYFYLQYEGADGRRIAHWVVPHSGETLPYTGRSILPELLNDLHFFKQLGTFGQMTAGVLGFVLLFVLVTGVAIDLRKLPEDPRATPWLHRLLARLTSGVGVGLLAAVPAAFVVSRLLPIDRPDRMVVEAQVFFATWGLLVLGALAWPSALATARLLVALSGVLSIAVPIANGLGTGAWPWTSAARGHWSIFTIDVCFLIAGLVLSSTFLAWRRFSPKSDTKR